MQRKTGIAGDPVIIRREMEDDAASSVHDACLNAACIAIELEDDGHDEIADKWSKVKDQLVSLLTQMNALRDEEMQKLLTQVK